MPTVALLYPRPYATPGENVRNFIFTEEERRLLKAWLEGRIARPLPTALRTLLTRIRRAEELLNDVELLIRAWARLARTKGRG